MRVRVPVFVSLLSGGWPQRLLVGVSACAGVCVSVVRRRGSVASGTCECACMSVGARARARVCVSVVRRRGSGASGIRPGERSLVWEPVKVSRLVS